MSAETPQGSPLLPSLFPIRIQENGSLITILVIAAVFWIHRLIKFIYNICCYWEIHSFYLHALRIPMVRLGSWELAPRPETSSAAWEGQGVFLGIRHPHPSLAGQGASA